MNNAYRTLAARDSRQPNFLVRLLLAALIAAGSLFSAGQRPVQAAALPSNVLAVAPGGSTSAGCGTSYQAATGWEAPCDLQTALNRAGQAGSPIRELWLKEGVYRPSTTDQVASFVIPSGLRVFGGFTGYESSRSQRTATPTDSDPYNDRLTILTGELQGDGSIANNAYNVVRVQNAAAVVVLDRLVITKGNASGGGLRINNSQVYISNSIITGNTASGDGAGIYAENNSQVEVVFSQFTDNTAGGKGGGLYARNADVNVRNSIFSQNRSTDGDGAFAGVFASLVVTNSIFYANPGSGDSIEMQTSSPHQSTNVSHTILETPCPANLICSNYSYSADPLLLTTYGPASVPVLSMAVNSPYYDLFAPALVPQDIYDLDGDGITAEAAYSIGGTPPTAPVPTAVTVFALTSEPQPDGIWVRWETASELNNLGFWLYRRAAGESEFTLLTPEIIPSQSPGSLLGAAYEYFDPFTPAQPCVYRLEALDADGSRQAFDLPYQPPTAAGGLLPRIFLPLVRH